MYIRYSQQKNLKTGQRYTSYRLVETYRNEQGKISQHLLLNLGAQFNLPKEQWPSLTKRIDEICKGQQALFDETLPIEKEAHRIAKLLGQRLSQASAEDTVSVEKATDYQTVDVNSLKHHDIRFIGAEHLGLFAAKQLHLAELLQSVGFNQKQANTAIATIIGRLVRPGSELSTHRYLTEQSALDELLDTDFSNLPLKNLYQISDKLLTHKTVIEEKLYQREKDLFQLSDIITLFDLTNTYFEGTAKLYSKAKYGRSKEKRSDCPLVTLGLVLDSSGFVKRSQIFAGNVSESSTLKEILSTLDGDKKPTVVMDAGIFTADNIAWLNEQGYHYIGVSRQKKVPPFEAVNSILVKDDKNNQVNVNLLKNEAGTELTLYCHSTAKEAKTRTMTNQSAARYELELQKLKVGLSKKRGLKRYEKMLERLGRLKEKYKQTAYFYTVDIEADDKKIVTDLTWKKSEDIIELKNKGIYCLRTNRMDLDAQTFWNMYVMLTDLESAFRSLKSELGLRPIYHQKEKRIDGHLFISTLAYHLLHTIRYQLKQKNIHESWQSLRALLSTHCRITSTLQLENGKTMQLRKTSSPNAEQANIYKLLGIDRQPVKSRKVYF